MHIFGITVSAGPTHPRCLAGTSVPVICMVNSRDGAAAEEMACVFLGEQGWTHARIQTSILLPEDPDISQFDTLMREAFADALYLGISLIEFPEPTDVA